MRAMLSRRPDVDFAAVCEENLDGVFGYLLYLTGNRTVSEDLTAETFERALRRLKRFDPRRGTARTWLLMLARSTALDHFRSEQRRRRREGTYALLETEVGEGDVFGHGFSPALEAALRSLSAGEREVVALRVLLELDGETAARLLGISPTACSTRLHRALQKLEEKVRDDVRA
jgi:RNA polymerase sigma-70 factor (ECF subfamily)